MPTKHPRISVTRDEQLAQALDGVAGLYRGAPEATVVRELALKGAAALGLEQEHRRAAVERLISVSTDPEGPLDRSVLGEIDAIAWR